MQKLATQPSSFGSGSKRKTASSVKFALSRNIEYCSLPIPEESQKCKWYAQDEYKNFKSSFIGLAKEFQKYDRANNGPESFGALLSSSFVACCKATDDNDSCFLGPQEEKLLKHWFDKCSRRGLERVSVPRILADKSTRRKEISAAVLDAQYDTRSMDDSEQRAELIRQASEEISLASRRFAWRLAR